LLPFGFGLAFLVFSRLVGMSALHAVDLRANAIFERIWWQPSFPFFEGIAVTGGIELTSLLAGSLFLLLLWRGRWREASALLVFPAALVVERFSKYLVDHPGPGAAHAGQLSVTRFISDQVNNSFPSGHVMRGVILFGLLAVLARRMGPPGWWTRLAVPVATLLVTAIAFDRLYLGVHWLSDVIGGLLLGGLSLAGALLWLDRSREWTARP
jgi:membrane-associated phospholipid phosphatase